MLRLSTKLDAEANPPRSDTPDSFRTTLESQDPAFIDGREHVEEPIALPPVERTSTPVDSGIDVADNWQEPDPSTLAKSQRRKLRKKNKSKEENQGRKTSCDSRFASRNAYEFLQDEDLASSSSAETTYPPETASNGNANGLHTPDSSWADQPSPYAQSEEALPLNKIQRQPMELMPDFDSPFWHKFGNKLRVFGTQESVMEIAEWVHSSELRMDKVQGEPVY
jgi:poly(A)-specific ribonuclease